MDWKRQIEQFEPVALTRGDLRVELDYWEDGHRGPFYDPDDPQDVPVLHLVTHRCTDEGEWEQWLDRATVVPVSSRLTDLTCYLIRAMSVLTDSPEPEAALDRLAWVKSGEPVLA